MNSLEVTQLLEEADQVLIEYAIEHLCADQEEQ